MNVGGLVVIGLAAFLIVMAIKGSQHSVFPQFFGADPLVPTPYQPANPNPGLPTAPDPTGACPKGYVLTRGQCVQFV